MNKLLIGFLIILTIVNLGIIVAIKTLQKPNKLGASFVESLVTRVASSTVDTPGTYFRANGALNNNNDGTGTTTLLTLTGIYQSDVVEIGLRAVATTSVAGDAKFKVEVSQDASLWSPIAFQDVITTTGTQNAQVFLNPESASTTFSWGFTANGTTTMNRLKFSHIAAIFLRVRAWATATTSLLAEGFLLSQ